jgi:hypothetical protein
MHNNSASLYNILTKASSSIESLCINCTLVYVIVRVLGVPSCVLDRTIIACVGYSMHLFNSQDVQFYGLLLQVFGCTQPCLSSSPVWFCVRFRMPRKGFLISYVWYPPVGWCASRCRCHDSLHSMLLVWYWYAYITDWLRVLFSILFLSLFAFLVSNGLSFLKVIAV